MFYVCDLKQSIMSKYINPITDFGFKCFFGTEGNKDLRIR